MCFLIYPMHILRLWRQTIINPKSADNFCINHGHDGDQRVFSIMNHHKCLSYLFRIHLNTYGMGLRSLQIF